MGWELYTIFRPIVYYPPTYPRGGHNSGKGVVM